jgi:prepilin-type N-terminal cleavage/methylation domain-containing protein
MEISTTRGNKWGSLGFTLIELMIVVAIIGILASIAIPKFANLVRKSKEGASKGNLGTIRSALSIYYSDMEGLYPQQSVFGVTNDGLQSLMISGKYLAAIPYAKSPDYHADTLAELDCLNAACSNLNDAGGWFYHSYADSNWGAIMINCTHTDTKGTLWTAY